MNSPTKAEAAVISFARGGHGSRRPRTRTAEWPKDHARAPRRKAREHGMVSLRGEVAEPDVAGGDRSADRQPKRQRISLPTPNRCAQDRSRVIDGNVDIFDRSDLVRSVAGRRFHATPFCWCPS